MLTRISHICGNMPSDFRFKGLVVTKSAMRTYDKVVTDRRGREEVVAGKMFVFTVRDHSGDIEVAVFDYNGASYFFDQISLDRVYIFENCTVIESSSYNLTDHDHSLKFSSSASVTYIKNGHYDYKPIRFSSQYIDDILNEACIGDPVNVMGVCVGDNGLLHVTRRCSGRQVVLREIYVKDQSGAKIKVKLWEHEARNFDSDGNPVVYIYGGRLKKFRGRLAVGTTMNTMLLLTLIEDTDLSRDLKKYRQHLINMGEIP